MHYLAQAGYFVLLIGALVFVHELGHFTVAKLCRVKVLRFSLGFGPRLLRFRRGETEYCLSLVPFGGFVKLLGDDPEDEVTAAERARAFHEKPLWQRFLVVFAGPAFNLLLPVGIYFVFFASQRTLPASVVGSVFRGQPADGLLVPGDRVIALDGQPIRYWRDFEEYVSAHPGDIVRMTVQRGHDVVQVHVPVREDKRPTSLLSAPVGMVGVSPRWLLPEVGIADPASPAAQAGIRSFDLVTTVNTEPVTSFAELEQRLHRLLSHGNRVRMTLLRGEPSGLEFADIELRTPATATILPTREPGLAGLRPAEFFLHEVDPQSPLGRAGLRAGDELVALDDGPIGSWELFDQALAAAPSRPHTIEWRTGRSLRRATFQPAIVSRLDEYRQRHDVVVHGATPHPLFRMDPPIAVENRLPSSLVRAFGRTADVASDMVSATWALARGRISRDTIGGPILVLQIAGVAAERGWDFFLAILALVSINIGLINLLPVPALDGGHLLFFAVEAARRRPLSPRTRTAAHYVGLVVIGLLVLLAVKNDVVRTLFP